MKTSVLAALLLAAPAAASAQVAPWVILNQPPPPQVYEQVQPEQQPVPFQPYYAAPVQNAAPSFGHGFNSSSQTFGNQTYTHINGPNGSVSCNQQRFGNQTYTNCN